jgi:FtsP/CotA-like multicopper oxidase with cupredoxin domain
MISRSESAKSSLDSSCCPSETTSDRPQRSALVPKGGGDKDNLEHGPDGDGSSNNGIHQRGWRSTDWYLIVVSVLMVATLVLGSCALLLGLARAQLEFSPPLQTAPGTTPSQGSFRRASDDYILGSDWNYDAGPTVREYDWVISDIVANPDGVFRPMTVINGLFPGELIRCNDGDTIVVHLENRSANATAIHFHGMFQNGTNFMDGTPGVTQCSIAPGQSFRYEFTVKGQAGTYFYHGHQAAQHLDGLVGPLIVHSRSEKNPQQVPYASDRVILLQDWYYDLSAGLLFDSLSPGSESSPIPNGALINGQNVADCSLHEHRGCDNTSANLPTFQLATQESHRLRLINSGGFAWFDVTIDGHPSLAIIEIDGTIIQPSTDNGVLLAPGQRYSVVLQPNDDNLSDSFWFRARMVETCFSKPVLPESGPPEAKAIINKATTPSEGHIPTGDAQPETEDDSPRHTTICKDMSSLARYNPLPPLDAPAYAHESWYLELNLKVNEWRMERGFMNDSSFRPNLQSPTINRILTSPAADAASLSSASEMILETTDISVVDIVLQNFDPGNHPFHLHGHYLWVLAGGAGLFPGYASLGFNPTGRGLLDPSSSSMLSNPLRRDVVTVEGKGWLLVRFVADNPGIWLFHCHMVWHGEAGMAMQFLSRADELRKMTLPDANLELCRVDASELEKGGIPKDSIWTGQNQQYIA